MKRQRYALLLLAGAALLTGCNTAPGMPASTSSHYEKPTPAKEQKFHATMIKVAQSTQNDPNYNRMRLETPEQKEWFKNLMYRLWDRQITRNQFIAEGTAKYPDHSYEFRYIANAYQHY